jgi:hypothetical protein
MDRGRFKKVAASFVAVSAIVGVGLQQTVFADSAQPVLATTWTGMTLGYMPWGNNSGANNFEQIPSTSNYFTRASNEMQFGTWFGSEWKAFTQFDPAMFTGKTITKAILNIPITQCGSAKAGAEYTSPIHIRKVTQAFWYGQTFPGSTTTDDITAMPAADDYATADITGIAQSWQDGAANLGVELDMGGATNTFCRAQRTTATNKFAYVELTYGTAPPFLNNSSFEAGVAGWRPCYNANTVSYDTPLNQGAADGQRILRFNSSSGSGSMCQTKPWKPRIGDYYQLAVRVRSASGVPVNGSASIWELRDPSIGTSWSTQVNFIADSEWKEYRTAACARNSEATQLRTELYVGTANQNLDVDVVQVAIANPSVCGAAPKP